MWTWSLNASVFAHEVQTLFQRQLVQSKLSLTDQSPCRRSAVVDRSCPNQIDLLSVWHRHADKTRRASLEASPVCGRSRRYYSSIPKRRRLLGDKIEGRWGTPDIGRRVNREPGQIANADVFFVHQHVDTKAVCLFIMSHWRSSQGRTHSCCSGPPPHCCLWARSGL